MTDKQLIETLTNIKNYCKKYDNGCSNCEFNMDIYRCQLSMLGCYLYNEPCKYDLKKLEEIIKQ